MANSTKVIASSIDRNGHLWGFTPRTERWKGRLVMIGFVSALLVELFSSSGILHV